MPTEDRRLAVSARRAMLSPSLAAAVMLAVMLAPMLPCLPAHAATVAATAVTPAEPRRVGLEVDVDNLRVQEDFDADAYQEMLEYALEQALERQGYALADGAGGSDGSGGSDAAIRTALAWADYENSHFRVTFWVTPTGGKTKAFATRTCKMCDPDQLVAQMEEQLAEALTHLEPAAGSTAGGTSGTGTGGPDDSGPEGTQDDRKRITGLGIAGIGFGVVGIAGVAAGAVLTARGTTQDFGDTNDSVNERNDRPPGIALLAGGGALLLTGIALITVDQIRLRRRAARRTAVAPVVLPRGAGIGFAARF